MSGNANTNFQQTLGQLVDNAVTSQLVATEQLITPGVV